MNEDKNIDIDIKKLLEKNDKIVVPKEISIGIDSVLENINKQRNNKHKFSRRLAVVSTIGILLFTMPFVARASIDKLYKYIPGNGNFIEDEGKIYILEKYITKQKGNADITLSSVNLNEEKKEIELKVEGEFYEPDKFAQLTINNSSRIGIGSMIAGSSGDRGPDKWIYTYTFKYDDTYNNEDIKIKISFKDGVDVIFNTKLKEAKAETNYKKLGITDEKLNITGVIEEDKNTLDVNFINDVNTTNEGVNYGIQPYPMSDWELNRQEYGIITLSDVNGKVAKGKFIEHEDRRNHFSFDTTDLDKPFNINIPLIEITTRGLVATSDEIELNIESDEIETQINKVIELKSSDDLYKSGNNKVRLIKGVKTDDKYTIYLENINAEVNPININVISIIPSGESIINNNDIWFEDGLSGSVEEDNIFKWTFKLPHINSEKLYIKLIDHTYKLEGNWNLVIE